jgi:hypothetical protein
MSISMRRNPNHLLQHIPWRLRTAYTEMLRSDVGSRREGMREIVLAIGLVALCAFQQARAIEPEPNWSARLDELKQIEIAAFKPPKVGDRITLERRVGGDVSGKITAITDATVTLDGRQFSASQLTPDTCDRIFAGVHAARIATERVQSERGDYNARRSAELRKQREDAQRLEVERKAAEAAAALKVEEQRRLEEERARADAERARIEAQNEQQRQARTTAIGVGVVVVALCITGFFIYILPSIIAFKRGHPNAGAICALNILLGWSLLGWAASLVWALTQQAPTNVTVTVNRPSPAPGALFSRGRKIIIRKRQE